MYKSKLVASKKTKKPLVNFLNNFLKTNKTCYCRSLKRKVYFCKLPEAIVNRQQSSTQRLQRFSVSLDILKHERNFTKRQFNGNYEYEIEGLDNSGKIIHIHLREELTEGRDKILYFISCF